MPHNPRLNVPFVRDCFGLATFASSLGAIAGYIAYCTVSITYDVSKVVGVITSSTLQVSRWGALKVYSLAPASITASPFVESLKASIPSFSNPFPTLPHVHVLKGLTHLTQFSAKLALVSLVAFVVFDLYLDKHESSRIAGFLNTASEMVSSLSRIGHSQAQDPHLNTSYSSSSSSASRGYPSATSQKTPVPGTAQRSSRNTSGRHGPNLDSDDT